MKQWSDIRRDKYVRLIHHFITRIFPLYAFEKQITMHVMAPFNERTYPHRFADTFQRNLQNFSNLKDIGSIMYRRLKQQIGEIDICKTTTV